MSLRDGPPCSRVFQTGAPALTPRHAWLREGARGFFLMVAVIVALEVLNRGPWGVRSPLEHLGGLPGPPPLWGYTKAGLVVASFFWLPGLALVRLRAADRAVRSGLVAEELAVTPLDPGGVRRAAVVAALRPPFVLCMSLGAGIALWWGTRGLHHGGVLGASLVPATILSFGLGASIGAGAVSYLLGLGRRTGRLLAVFVPFLIVVVIPLISILVLSDGIQMAVLPRGSSSGWLSIDGYVPLLPRRLVVEVDHSSPYSFLRPTKTKDIRLEEVHLAGLHLHHPPRLRPLPMVFGQAILLFGLLQAIPRRAPRAWRRLAGDAALALLPCAATLLSFAVLTPLTLLLEWPTVMCEMAGTALATLAIALGYSLPIFVGRPHPLVD